METPKPLPPGLYRRGAVYWIRYSIAGTPIRESTGTENLAEAKRFLDERKGRIATGAPILPRADKVRYEEAAKDLREHYQTTGDRDLTEAECRLKHLDAFFTGSRLAGIGPDIVTKYQKHRESEGAENGTINREVGVLSKMLRLAYENGKLLRLPVIRKLGESAPRSGFFERKKYEAVRRHLEPDPQVACAIAHECGWRMQREVLALGLRQVNLEAGTLSLDAGQTKNDDGRVVYLTPQLRALVSEQVARVRALERQLGRIIPHLFPHPSGSRRVGTPRRDFRKAWATATRKAGCPGMLRHDFRRTAVRNMVNAGDAGAGRHEGHRASDALGVRPLPHREPDRPAVGSGQARCRSALAHF
jgi:integrase